MFRQFRANSLFSCLDVKINTGDKQINREENGWFIKGQRDKLVILGHLKTTLCWIKLASSINF